MRPGTDAGHPANVSAEPAPLLIVTDDKNVAAMVCTPVIASRVRVLVEPSGIKALNMVQSGLKPQVVVSSATSLDMEGGVLAKMLAIRDLATGVPAPKNQRIPFILLANHGKKAQNFSPKDVDQLFDLPDDAATLEQYLLRLLR
jgi:CheY-like chemotaxis protein